MVDRLLKGGEAQYHGTLTRDDHLQEVSGWHSKARLRHLASKSSSNACDGALVDGDAALHMSHSLADSRQVVSGGVACQGAVMLPAYSSKV